jgi:hypothetical protein
MFRQWRAQRLIQRLTGLRARNIQLKRLLDNSEKSPACYVDEYLDLCQEIASLEFKIEMLEDGK